MNRSCRAHEVVRGPLEEISMAGFLSAASECVCIAGEQLLCSGYLQDGHIPDTQVAFRGLSGIIRFYTDSAIGLARENLTLKVFRRLIAGW